MLTSPSRLPNLSTNLTLMLTSHSGQNVRLGELIIRVDGEFTEFFLI